MMPTLSTLEWITEEDVVLKKTQEMELAFFLLCRILFFQDQAKKININLPDFGSYAVGNIFLPQDQKERSFCKKIVEQTIKSEGQKFLGWRKVPINPKKADVGPAARDCQPEIEQVFVQKSTKLDQESFERKLYLIRKIFTKRLRYQENLSQASLFYACTLSSRLIAYKGMLTPAQLFPFFPRS